MILILLCFGIFFLQTLNASHEKNHIAGNQLHNENKPINDFNMDHEEIALFFKQNVFNINETPNQGDDTSNGVDKMDMDHEVISSFFNDNDNRFINDLSNQFNDFNANQEAVDSFFNDNQDVFNDSSSIISFSAQEDEVEHAFESIYQVLLDEGYCNIPDDNYLNMNLEAKDEIFDSNTQLNPLYNQYQGFQNQNTHIIDESHLNMNLQFSDENLLLNVKPLYNQDQWFQNQKNHECQNLVYDPENSIFSDNTQTLATQRNILKQPIDKEFDLSKISNVYPIILYDLKSLDGTDQIIMEDNVNLKNSNVIDSACEEVYEEKMALGNCLKNDGNKLSMCKGVIDKTPDIYKKLYIERRNKKSDENTLIKKSNDVKQLIEIIINNPHSNGLQPADTVISSSTIPDILVNHGQKRRLNAKTLMPCTDKETITSLETKSNIKTINEEIISKRVKLDNQHSLNQKHVNNEGNNSQSFNQIPNINSKNNIVAKENSQIIIERLLCNGTTCTISDINTPLKETIKPNQEYFIGSSNSQCLHMENVIQSAPIQLKNNNTDMFIVKIMPPVLHTDPSSSTNICLDADKGMTNKGLCTNDIIVLYSDSTQNLKNHNQVISMPETICCDKYFSPIVKEGYHLEINSKAFKVANDIISKPDNNKIPTSSENISMQCISDKNPLKMKYFFVLTKSEAAKISYKLSFYLHLQQSFDQSIKNPGISYQSANKELITAIHYLDTYITDTDFVSYYLLKRLSAEMAYFKTKFDLFKYKKEEFTFFLCYMIKCVVDVTQKKPEKINIQGDIFIYSFYLIYPIRFIYNQSRGKNKPYGFVDDCLLISESIFLLFISRKDTLSQESIDFYGTYKIRYERFYKGLSKVKGFKINVRDYEDILHPNKSSTFCLKKMEIIDLHFKEYFKTIQDNISHYNKFKNDLDLLSKIEKIIMFLIHIIGVKFLYSENKDIIKKDLYQKYAWFMYTESYQLIKLLIDILETYIMHYIKGFLYDIYNEISYNVNKIKITLEENFLPGNKDKFKHININDINRLRVYNIVLFFIKHFLNKYGNRVNTSMKKILIIEGTYRKIIRIKRKI